MGDRVGARASRAAGTLDRVATLVAAGVPPPRAWELVGGLPRDTGPACEDVAVVLRVAERTGAPLAETLRALAAALRRSAASDRAIRVALAGPRTSARVVLALPFFGLALGMTWGSGAVEVLVGSPVGWACVVVAGMLVLLGRGWSARLVRAATPDGHVAGILLDAWAVAVSGGGSWIAAGTAVQAAVAAAGSSDAAGSSAAAGSSSDAGSAAAASSSAASSSSWGGAAGDDVARLREVLDLAGRAGVPAGGLLRRAAEDVRDDAAADGLAAAERLAVRLVLPLGVCVLPAFVLVGVVPVVAGVLSSTVGGLR